MNQLLLNIFIASCSYLLIAISFSIIYRTAYFFHFAHGSIFMLGAYFVYFINVISNYTFSISILFSIIFCSLLGIIINSFVYKPIRRINGSSLILLIASLGIFIILQNAVSLFWGEDIKTLRNSAVKEGFVLLGARITTVQIIIVVSGIVLTVSTLMLLKYTKTGTASRAVANNPRLSEIYGINKEKIYNVVFAYGSALAAIAGILSALDTDMTPTMGFRPLMMGVIAMIIGGVGSIPGIVLGALLLGFAQNFAAWYLPSQWQDAIAFAIMLIFLLFRPQGFFGKPLKKAEV